VRAQHVCKLGPPKHLAVQSRDLLCIFSGTWNRFSSRDTKQCRAE